MKKTNMLTSKLFFGYIINIGKKISYAFFTKHNKIARKE